MDGVGIFRHDDIALGLTMFIDRVPYQRSQLRTGDRWPPAAPGMGHDLWPMF